MIFVLAKFFADNKPLPMNSILNTALIFALTCLFAQATAQDLHEAPAGPFIDSASYVPPAEGDRAACTIPINSRKQCGQSWSSSTLGFCTTTICQEGCALACATMVLNANGISIDPGQLNTWLKSNSGYTTGNCLIYWNAVTNYPNASLTWYGSTAYNLAVIKAEIDAGNPVIIHVNRPYGSTSTATCSHFVVAYSYTNSGTSMSDFIIADPGVSAFPTNLSNYTICSESTALRIYRNVNGCQAVAACTDNFESNNTSATATNVFASPLNTGASNYTPVGTSIGFAGDVDWFKVNIGSCGTLTLNLSNLPLNYDIELYGPNGSNGSAISGSYSSGTNGEQITYSATGATTVYAKVYSSVSSSFSAANCYNLQFLWTPCEPSCSAPANNVCTGATPLTPSAICNYAQYSSCGATNSAINTCTGTQDDDVWFVFTANATSTTINMQGLADYDAVFQVLSSPCNGTMTQYSCTNNTGVGATESATIATSVGSQYYIRAWHAGTGYGTTGNFNMCVQSQPTQPCTYSLSQYSQNFSPSGGSGSFTINATANSGCNWTVSEGSTGGCSLLSVTSLSQGTGPYTITYTLAENSSGYAQTCTLTVTGNNGYSADYIVTQDANTACNSPYADPNTQTYPQAGAQGSFIVNTGTGCYWSIYNSCGSMLTNISPTSGTGPTTVTYTVLSNPNSTQRDCWIYISQNNASHRVVQLGSCTPPTAPAISPSGTNPVCLGDSLLFTVTNPCSGCSYVWSDGGSGTSRYLKTNGTYYAFAQNTCGTSSNSNTVGISISSPPTVTVSASPATIQAGGTSQLQATGGGTYNWSDGLGTASNVGVMPSQTTNYRVTVTMNQCSAMDSVTVVVNPANCTNPPTANAGNNATFTGATVTIGGAPTASGGMPPYTYLWSPVTGLNSATDANPVISNITVTTTYLVTVTDANNCSALSYATVYVNSPGTCNLAVPEIESVGCELAVVNRSIYSPAASFVWHIGGGTPITPCTGPYCTATQNGFYSVTVFDDNCSYPSQHDEAVSGCTTGINDIPFTEPLQLLPNPNNGQFLIRINSGAYAKLKVNIYDMVGRKVFGEEYNPTGSAHFEKQLSLEGLSPGVYVLQVEGEQYSRSMRFEIYVK